jgi:ribonucleoside-diphosphate reductase alpha chain
MDKFANEISRHVWQTKYRFADHAPRERSIADTWRRVARALAAVEPKDSETLEDRFFEFLQDFKFLPGGRIQAGAGTARNVTLFNCFVMGTIEDSIPGIFSALEEGPVTMQQGGGIGIDFSTLRPRGSQTKTVGGIASGPVSFMQLWGVAACGTILSTGVRRGAMMATLRCDHPDIEEFVTAKQQAGQLRAFQCVGPGDRRFYGGSTQRADWSLLFPAAAVDGGGQTVVREWPGSEGSVPCSVVRHIRARHLWDLILRSTYDYAEPGVLFVDRINKLNNLWYREHISATNPCGEIPLPPYGAYDLGSLNLTRFVVSPFTAEARIDHERLTDTVRIAVRMLDNVIDASRFPLPRNVIAQIIKHMTVAALVIAVSRMVGMFISTYVH